MPGYLPSLPIIDKLIIFVHILNPWWLCSLKMRVSIFPLNVGKPLTHLDSFLYSLLVSTLQRMSLSQEALNFFFIIVINPHLPSTVFHFVGQKLVYT